MKSTTRSNTSRPGMSSRFSYDVPVEMICLQFISIVSWNISDYDREHGILEVHPNAMQAFTICFQSQDVSLPAVDDNGDPYGLLTVCLSDLMMISTEFCFCVKVSVLLASVTLRTVKSVCLSIILLV